MGNVVRSLAASVAISVAAGGSAAAETMKVAPVETGAATSELAAPHPRPLPPIENPLWFNGEEGFNYLDEVAEATFEKTGYRFSFDRKLPRAYKEAFRAALSHPIVRLAAQTGAVEKFSITTDEFDNGEFWPSEKSLNFVLSDGQRPEKRIFFDQRIFTAVGIHESAHALTENWFHYIHDNERPADPMLAEKIDRLVAACVPIRNTIFTNFVDLFRPELVDAYSLASTGFFAKAYRAEHDHDPSNDTEVTKLNDLGEYMALTADAISADDAAIYQPLSNPGCEFVDVFEIPHDVVGVDGQEGEFSEFAHITARLHSLDYFSADSADLRYKCIKDGKVIDRWLGTKRRLAAGHSFDDLGEAAASLITGLTLAPDYVDHCLAKLPSKQRSQFETLFGALLDVIDYTQPQLIEILEQQPPARELIDDFTDALTIS